MREGSEEQKGMMEGREGARNGATDVRGGN